jgi:hypothetical protein
MIYTQGNWQVDAAALTTTAVLLIILKGGTMSRQTRNLIAIAATGAVAALLIDGYIKPKMLP